MKKAGMLWCMVLVWGILVLNAGAAVAGDDNTADDPYDAVCGQIVMAIQEKTAMLESINAILEKEQAAYDALGEMLASGDYAGLKKGDIIQAQQKIFSAMQHEIQAADALDKSIEKLEDSLASLGWEPPVGPEPVSYWMLDEGEGDTAYDSVGANHGTIHGASWIEGVIGTGLSFDGYGDYVVVPDNDDSLDFGANQNFSISLWFRIAAGPITGGPHLIEKRMNGEPYQGYVLAYEDRPSKPGYQSALFFIDWGPGAVSLYSQTKVNDGQWHHIVAVREGQTLRLYVDGAFEAEDSATEYAADLTNTNPFLFGINQYLGGKDYYGSLDEVAVFGEALTEEAVYALYEQGAGLP